MTAATTSPTKIFAELRQDAEDHEYTINDLALLKKSGVSNNEIVDVVTNIPDDATLHNYQSCRALGDSHAEAMKVVLIHGKNVSLSQYTEIRAQLSEHSLAWDIVVQFAEQKPTNEQWVSFLMLFRVGLSHIDASKLALILSREEATLLSYLKQDSSIRFELETYLSIESSQQQAICRQVLSLVTDIDTSEAKAVAVRLDRLRSTTIDNYCQLRNAGMSDELALGTAETQSHKVFDWLLALAVSDGDESGAFVLMSG